MPRRALLILGIAALGIAAPVFAQEPVAPVAAPRAPTAAELEQQLVQTSQQLQAAQGEIVRLRTLVADAETQRTALDGCTAKNGRLVTIGNELIAAYGKRYRRSQFEPFQLARRRFEAELQAQGDAIHENRADAVAAAPAPAEAPVDAAAPAPAPAEAPVDAATPANAAVPAETASPN